MALIDAHIDIISSVDKVWDIISDLDNEPEFWKGTKETKIISREDNVIISCLLYTSDAADE